MPTTIKVDRRVLITALEAEQKKQVADFKREMERYRDAEKAYPEKLADALEQAAKQVRRGNIPKGSTNAYYDNKYHDIPHFSCLPERKPKPPRDNRDCELQRMIRTLKLCTDDFIRLNENSCYIQFICKLTK